MDITGASAIVTGGASGLGLATAKRLVAMGAKVVIVDLAQSRGAEIAGSLGDAVRFVAADVTSGPDIEKAVEQAGALGPLRVVVNCAGIAPPAKVVGREGPMPLEAFTRIIQINLIGTFNVIRLAAAAMQKLDPVDGERGVIVNTASVAAFEGQIGQPAYAASKGGVVAMTLPIAREFAQSLIRVNAIAPGLFETPMMASLPDAARESLAVQVPNPSRLGRAAEYAALAAHIIENQYINGETIRLDGAIRLGPK